MVPKVTSSLRHYFREIASDGKLDRARGTTEKNGEKNKSERGNLSKKKM